MAPTSSRAKKYRHWGKPRLDSVENDNIDGPFIYRTTTHNRAIFRMLYGAILWYIVLIE